MHFYLEFLVCLDDFIDNRKKIKGHSLHYFNPSHKFQSCIKSSNSKQNEYGKASWYLRG
ncbi:hypothetical protein E2C01_003392 [Portunus trituberculatus]|uniref:Uncharacterized protein n=1 Tax=Portunus trituberculatus TaxID=210409 RepID=A0A5B7CM42_PORTR|nr:hypothetical protein [Portunus trituberculatus]